MDKKSSTSKLNTTNKTTAKPKTTQNDSKDQKQPTKVSSKEVASVNTSQKKETTKLNPVKPRGKAGEAEKKTLRQARESQPNRNNRAIGGKNAKKEKKEVEKELYLRFGKHVLNIKEEEQDLDDTTFLRYNVIGILFTGSWVPPAKEFMQNSRLGTRYEYVAFLGVLIKKLVEKGWTVTKAWNAMCTDSKELGHYWNSDNAKRAFEDTGSREVCGFYDLANTCKILAEDKEVGGFWLAGGSYFNNSDFFTLADILHYNYCYDDQWLDQWLSVGWLVFDV